MNPWNKQIFTITETYKFIGKDELIIKLSLLDNTIKYLYYDNNYGLREMVYQGEINDEINNNTTITLNSMQLIIPTNNNLITYGGKPMKKIIINKIDTMYQQLYYFCKKYNNNNN